MVKDDWPPTYDWPGFHLNFNVHILPEHGERWS